VAHVNEPPAAEVSLARISALLELMYDQQVASRNLLELIRASVGAQDAQSSARVENNSRGTTTEVKAYAGSPVHELVDEVAREAKRLQVMASGSLAGVMDDGS